MNFIRDLLIDNPMMVEIQKFRQRTFSTRRGGGNLALVILVLAFYLLIVLVVAKSAKDIDPIGLVIFQAFVYALLVPVMTCGAIAGERERRTWDILLVAPVTKAQLVAGKTVAALTGVAVFAVALLVPIGICSLVNPDADLSVTAAAELYSLGFAWLLVSVSIYVSSRAKTMLAALGVSLSLVFAALVVAPGFWAMAFAAIGHGYESPQLNWYPFYVLFGLGDHNSAGYAHSEWRITLTTLVAYAIAASILFAGAVWQVRRMEDVGNSLSGEGKGAKKLA